MPGGLTKRPSSGSPFRNLSNNHPGGDRPASVARSLIIRKNGQALRHRIVVTSYSYEERTMKPDTTKTYQERILNVLVHIQGHLDDALCLEDLAKVARFSPYHFHRIFRGMVGESVMEHIRRLRLERAAIRLKHVDTPVTRIAFDAGFETHEAFTRAFRSMFDRSPSEFRKQHQDISVVEAPSGVHFAPDGVLTNFEPVQMGGTSMNVRVEKLNKMKVAFMRHTGPYDAVGSTWTRFMGWAGQRGLLRPNTTILGMSHDDPAVTPPEHQRHDACLRVDDTFQGEGEIGVQEVGGGEYAVITHHGPYHKMNDSYEQLCGGWLPTSGRELRSSPALEFYRNSPYDTPPEKLVTDIYMPLES